MKLDKIHIMMAFDILDNTSPEEALDVGIITALISALKLEMSQKEFVRQIQAVSDALTNLIEEKENDKPGEA